MKKSILFALALAFVGGFAVARGEDLANVEDLVTSLNNPCAVAIQPTTGKIFVADSGNGKIIRVDPKDKKTEDVITGFGKDVYGKGPMYDIGPLGLVFLNEKTLIVGGGDKVDEQEVVYVFEVPDAGKSIKAEEAKQKLGPLGKTPEGAVAEGNYYGLALGKANDKTALFVTCNGDDTKGWVARALYNDKDKKFEDFKRSIATKDATKVDAPVAVAISPKGRVVIGQMGEINVPKDCLLTWYDPTTGGMLMNLKTNLHDITGLAYSRKTNFLYATDFSWGDTKDGGLFRIEDDGKKQDDSSKGINLTKIVSLDKPTALVVNEDGVLYATIIGAGTGKDNADTSKSGKLLKITGKKEAL